VDGKVAHFAFNAPEPGYLTVIAHFVAAIRNNFDGVDPITRTDCGVSTELSTVPGLVRNMGGASMTFVPGSLPTEAGAGTFFWVPQTVSRTFQVPAGNTTVYLNGLVGVNGSTGCKAVLWYNINVTAFLSRNNTAIAIIPN
jgi:hypothetical protein